MAIYARERSDVPALRLDLYREVMCQWSGAFAEVEHG